jgi:chemotaxis protein methyltransferase CheR
MSALPPAAHHLFARLLEDRTGQQIGAGRHWRIDAALRTLAQARHMASVEQLAIALDDGRNTELLDALVDALLNHETYFFRDRAPFDLLASVALPRLATLRKDRRRLRIWSAGCSTGQEAYSIAMLIADQGDFWEDWTIDILGTDVSGATIARANEALFSRFEVQRGLPVQTMLRYFTQEGDEWRINPELRRQLRFLRHNLLDPSPGRFDLILCRNVLLYLAPALRRRVFERLASALLPGGVLMLGAGETVIGQTTAFAPDPDCRGLYRLAGTSNVGIARAS